jgi:hypothetical protein
VYAAGHGATTGFALVVGNGSHGCTLELEVLSMSEEYPELRRRIRQFPNPFEPTQEDLREVVEHLKRRMDTYELEHLARDMSLEDVVKVLLLRGHPLAYVSREIRETRETRTEGLIFKHPVETSNRYLRELRILSRGYGYEPDISST